MSGEGRNETTGDLGAAFLAAGFGSLYLGLLVCAAEASPAVKALLTFSRAVGPLSGKTLVAVALWLATWVGFHLAWRRRNVRLDRVSFWSLLLVGLGFALTFPPIFELFAH